MITLLLAPLAFRLAFELAFVLTSLRIKIGIPQLIVSFCLVISRITVV